WFRRALWRFRYEPLSLSRRRPAPTLLQVLESEFFFCDRAPSGITTPAVTWIPAREAVIQLAFSAPSLQITPSRRRPGPIVQPAWSCPMGHGRRSDQTQVRVEAGPSLRRDGEKRQ